MKIYVVSLNFLMLRGPFLCHCSVIVIYSHLLQPLVSCWRASPRKSSRIFALPFFLQYSHYEPFFVKSTLVAFNCFQHRNCAIKVE